MVEVSDTLSGVHDFDLDLAVYILFGQVQMLRIQRIGTIILKGINRLDGM
jgi:hypothetical protein